MHPHPEIWGLHGAEQLSPDGKLDREELHPEDSAALKEARLAAHAEADGFRPPLRVEEKWNAVVVHWRGRSAHAARTAEELTLKLFSPLAGADGLKLLQFDGGIELRAGRNKGEAVRLMLNELDHDVPVAYLGDDTTDEDAFHALTGVKPEAEPKAWRTRPPRMAVHGGTSLASSTKPASGLSRLLGSSRGVLTEVVRKPFLRLYGDCKSLRLTGRFILYGVNSVYNCRDFGRTGRRESCWARSSRA